MPRGVLKATGPLPLRARPHLRCRSGSPPCALRPGWSCRGSLGSSRAGRGRRSAGASPPPPAPAAGCRRRRPGAGPPPPPHPWPSPPCTGWTLWRRAHHAAPASQPPSRRPPASRPWSRRSPFHSRRRRRAPPLPSGQLGGAAPAGGRPAARLGCGNVRARPCGHAERPGGLGAGGGLTCKRVSSRALNVRSQ